MSLCRAWHISAPSGLWTALGQTPAGMHAPLEIRLSLPTSAYCLLVQTLGGLFSALDASGNQKFWLRWHRKGKFPILLALMWLCSDIGCCESDANHVVWRLPLLAFVCSIHCHIICILFLHYFHMFWGGLIFYILQPIIFTFFLHFDLFRENALLRSR